MLKALTIPEAPRSWKEWTAFALLNAGVAGTLAWVGSHRDLEPLAFWVLWAVMAGAMSALLTHRAVLLVRHGAGESTPLDRALWRTAELAGLIVLVGLVLSDVL